MQNKANFQMAKMDVCVYVKGCYGDFTHFQVARKQSQFKAKQSQFAGH
jgi:hypothetical protein